MRKILALMLLSTVVHAEQEPLLAQARFLDAASLDRFYDAAAMRAGFFNPPMAGHDSSSTNNNVRRALDRRAVPQRAPLVLIPRPSRAYRNTFRILMTNPEKTDRYDELILRNSSRYGLNPRFVKAIIAAESEFFLGAVSPKGAKGLMQVLPATAQEVGIQPVQLRSAEGNIHAGAGYLAVLFEAAWRKYKLKGVRYHDAPTWVLQRIVAAYNAGPRFLMRKKLFRETRNYVRKVMLFYNSRVTDLRRPPEPTYTYPSVDFTAEAGS